MKVVLFFLQFICIGMFFIAGIAWLFEAIKYKEIRISSSIISAFSFMVFLLLTFLVITT